MPIPGARLEHYGLAVLLTVETAVSAWLFWPMLYVFRRRLTDAQLERDATPRPNVRFLLLWTAQAALILTTVAFIGDVWQAPQYRDCARFHSVSDGRANRPHATSSCAARRNRDHHDWLCRKSAPFVHCRSRRTCCLVCWSATRVVGSGADPRPTVNFRRDGQSMGRATTIPGRNHLRGDGCILLCSPDRASLQESARERMRLARSPAGDLSGDVLVASLVSNGCGRSPGPTFHCHL